MTKWIWDKKSCDRGRACAFATSAVWLLAACSMQSNSDVRGQGAALGESASRYVVVFEPDRLLTAQFEQAIESAGGSLVTEPAGYITQLAELGIAIATSSDSNFGAQLEGTVGVESCSKSTSKSLEELFPSPSGEGPIAVNGPTSQDVLFGSQWYLQRINAPAAWDNANGDPFERVGTQDTVVAVIDVGVAWNHPDLTEAIGDRRYCFATQGFCQNYPIGTHGTGVAAAIAARFGGGALVGVGPGLGLASYNVIEFVDQDGDGVPESPAFFDENAWAALLDVADRGYQVANMSFGGVFELPEQRALLAAYERVTKEVQRRGVTLIASAGNEGLFLNNPNSPGDPQLTVLPAGSQSVLAVGATAIRPGPTYDSQVPSEDIRAFYSNYGYRSSVGNGQDGKPLLSLTAPGGDCGGDNGLTDCFLPQSAAFFLPVASFQTNTPPGCIFTENCEPSYSLTIGTSLSAPQVAAVAGLMLDANPQLQPETVGRLLRRSAEAIGEIDRRARVFFDPEFGYGLLDAGAAVDQAAAH